MVSSHGEINMLRCAAIFYLWDFLTASQAETLVAFSPSPGKLVAIWTNHKSSTHIYLINKTAHHIGQTSSLKKNTRMPLAWTPGHLH